MREAGNGELASGLFFYFRLFRSGSRVLSEPSNYWLPSADSILPSASLTILRPRARPTNSPLGCSFHGLSPQALWS